MLTLLIYPALRLSKRLAGSAAKTQALSTECQRRTRRIGGLQGDLEARFTMALPGRGRSIMGEWAATVLVQDLPRSATLASLACVRRRLVPTASGAGGECACGSLQSDTRAGHALQPYIPLSVQVCRAGPAIQQPAPCCAAAPCALCGGPGVPAQSTLWAAPGSICGRWVHLAKVRVSCLSSGPTGVSARSDGGLQAVVRAPPLGPTLFSSKPGMHFKTCA